MATMLAALPIAVIIWGPALRASIGGRSLLISASQLTIAVLVVYVGVEMLGGSRYRQLPSGGGWLLASVTLLVLPVFWSSDLEGGTVAYLNFASGTIGGLAIALIWTNTQRGTCWIDIGYLVFVTGTILQLLIAFSEADSKTMLHQSSRTAWGNSNFVAGCLVVGAFALMGRSAKTRKYRTAAAVIGFTGIAVALFTLSRGAIIAACTGMIFFLWSSFSKFPERRLLRSGADSSKPGTFRTARLLARIMAVFVPVAAFQALAYVTSLRAEVNGRVYVNVDTRVELYKLAWQEFLAHPLTGTGWASLRDSTQTAMGQSNTFAHNILFSMLQIGGLMAVPYLLALFVLVYRGLKLGGNYAAAIAAAIAISLTDPFFESTAGNLLFLPVAVLAISTSSTSRDHSDMTESDRKATTH